MPLPSLKDIVPHWWGKREVRNDRPDTAPPARRDGSDPFQTLHGEITRVFGDFWRTLETGPFGAGFGSPGGLAGPRAEVSETDTAMEVAIELPGFDEKDLDVSVAGGLLTVKAERKSETGDRRTGFSERSYGLIRRTMSLPPDVNADAAAARYHNGVLTVSLPKTALPGREVKRITVRAA